ncbi:hypothetical protein FACS189445_1190 [Spirochaetia bacterium]|nr:hypothetical protein FACS189445_1190 [Spirochaetia bacterium]
MTANRLLLMHKYIRIIQAFSSESGKPLREALELFYLSETHSEMEHGISDMHCRSDGYLAEELSRELESKSAGAVK